MRSSRPYSSTMKRRISPRRPCFTVIHLDKPITRPATKTNISSTTDIQEYALPKYTVFLHCPVDWLSPRGNSVFPCSWKFSRKYQSRLSPPQQLLQSDLDPRSNRLLFCTAMAAVIEMRPGKAMGAESRRLSGKIRVISEHGGIRAAHLVHSPSSRHTFDTSLFPGGARSRRRRSTPGGRPSSQRVSNRHGTLTNSWVRDHPERLSI